jgi:ketoreductase RED1
VQENGPEKIAFKRKLWAAIEAAAPEDALLLSSSSSIPASEQNRDMVDPGRLIIGHPFNPPHLMPLVEVVPSAASNPDLVVRAMAFYREVGKVPLELKKEIPGFVANRLQAAIFRECVYLVREGIVSIRDLDAIVTMLGLRWAAMVRSCPSTSVAAQAGWPISSSIWARAGWRPCGPVSAKCLSMRQPAIC